MRNLRFEDAALAGWNALAVPLLAGSGLSPLIQLGDEPHLLAGIVQLVAVIGAIVAIATRPASGGPSALPGPSIGMLEAIIGPLVLGVAFVAGSAAVYLGLSIDEPITGIAFLTIVAAMAFGDRLPVIDAGLRRLLVLPFILVSAGIFNGFAADLLTGLDPRLLAAASFSAEAGFVLFVGLMVVGGLAVFYAGLVAAPRLLADPGQSGAWPLRFLVYLLSALFGIGWLTAFVG
jgi:hypothetical protein